MCEARHVWSYFLVSALVFVVVPAARWRHAESDAAPALAQAPPERDGQHDFDFAFGRWTVKLRRLLHPLSGSDAWVEMEGTSIVRKVWDGRANLGELKVGNASGNLEGLSLRLDNPETRQWSIYWANARDGALGTAMIGQFKNGRGEFFNQELFQGRPIFVRFIFSEVAPASFRLEQAFSADGGTTWEPKWIAIFAKLKE